MSQIHGNKTDVVNRNVLMQQDRHYQKMLQQKEHELARMKTKLDRNEQKKKSEKSQSSKSRANEVQDKIKNPKKTGSSSGGQGGN